MFTVIRRERSLISSWKEILEHACYYHYKATPTSLAKWLIVRLRTKWLWIRVQLQSPAHLVTHRFTLQKVSDIIHEAFFPLFWEFRHHKIHQAYVLQHPLHSTLWKLGLRFVYIFKADWNFFTKFWGSDPNFNRNILTSLYLKSETSAYAQLHNYSFIHTIYKFHHMMSVGNLHWGYLLIHEVYRQRHACGRLTFPRKTFCYGTSY